MDEYFFFSARDWRSPKKKTSLGLGFMFRISSLLVSCGGGVVSDAMARVCFLERFCYKKGTILDRLAGMKKVGKVESDEDWFFVSSLFFKLCISYCFCFGCC